MWTLLEMFLEEKVLHNDSKIKIVDTLHSRQRKQRSNNQGRLITDKDILKLVYKAVPILHKEDFDDNIPINRKVWLYDKKTRLNIIIEYKVVAETNRDKITILTVMRHNKFHPSKDTTKKIEV